MNGSDKVRHAPSLKRALACAAVAGLWLFAPAPTRQTPAVGDSFVAATVAAETLRDEMTCTMPDADGGRVTDVGRVFSSRSRGPTPARSRLASSRSARAAGARPADQAEGARPQTPSLGAELAHDLAPVRAVFDPYPSFNGIAVDAANRLVLASDTNRKSLLLYEGSSAGPGTDVTQPIRQIMGPQTGIGFISGVAMDPERRELYTVNNDVEDRAVVFSYDAHGNVKPKRLLYVPHQSWGISLNRKRDEIAFSVQSPNMYVVYRREAKGLEPPVRSVRGAKTGMADPHGLFFDEVNDEVVVANHGNWREAELVTSYTAWDSARSRQEARPDEGHREAVTGKFLPPSITIFAGDAKGDVAPKRTIAGGLTQLDWPMGVASDAAHNEIVVANNGDDAVLIFSRAASGDAAPVRVIRGRRTGISSPMGVAVAGDEIWVANFGDHNALVFPRLATGNVAPRRILRNAPAGSPTSGFGNPYAVAYDSKRGQILVPN